MSWQRYSTPLFCWAHKKWGGGWNCLWPGWINLIKEFLEFPPPPFGKFPPDVEYLWRVTCGGKKKIRGKKLHRDRVARENMSSTLWGKRADTCFCRKILQKNISSCFVKKTDKKVVFFSRNWTNKRRLVFEGELKQKTVAVVGTESCLWGYEQKNLTVWMVRNRKMWLCERLRTEKCDCVRG